MTKIDTVITDADRDRPGGDKTEIIAPDEQGQQRLRSRVPTIRGDYDATLSTLCELVTNAEKQHSYSETVMLAAE